jgi:hypothetical protein
MSEKFARAIPRPVPGAYNPIRDLVQNVAALELLQPSSTIWLVSPWLRDIELLDNRAGAYSAVGPDLPLTRLHLSHILAHVVRSGGQLVIVTRFPRQTRFLIDRLRIQLSEADYEARVRHDQMEALHTKGWLGDAYGIAGSMNFTNNGLWHQDELITFHTDPHELAKLRLEFTRSYGGGA